MPGFESGAASQGAGPEVVAEGLVVARGGHVLAGPLSFRLRAGESLLLTGPNGSGKTTLLRTLAGFIAPHAGWVSELSEHCHLVGHRDGVKASLTVRENLGYAARLLGSGAGRVEATLAQLALAPLAGFRAGQLSAGQRRRLSLARLLVAPRPVWLLDEPTTALDAASQAAFAALVAAQLRAGGVVVAATHLPLAVDFAQRLELGA